MRASFVVLVACMALAVAQARELKQMPTLLTVEAPAPAPVPAAAPSPAVDPLPSPSPSPSSSPSPAGPKSYTMAEVATHASADSLWAAIKGNVYDLTQWVGMHPGGAGRILAIGGTDASIQYNMQHGGDSLAENELAQFYLGPLAAA